MQQRHFDQWESERERERIDSLENPFNTFSRGFSDITIFILFFGINMLLTIKKVTTAKPRIEC